MGNKGFCLVIANMSFLPSIVFIMSKNQMPSQTFEELGLERESLRLRNCHLDKTFLDVRQGDL